LTLPSAFCKLFGTTITDAAPLTGNTSNMTVPTAAANPTACLSSFTTRRFSVLKGYKETTSQCKPYIIGPARPGWVLTASGEWEGVVLKLRFK
jgi:hypothetical protein